MIEASLDRLSKLSTQINWSTNPPYNAAVDMTAHSLPRRPPHTLKLKLGARTAWPAVDAINVKLQSLI